MQKVAIITGGSKGIGHELVIKFLNEGYNVISVARSSIEAHSFGNNLIQIKADLCKKVELKEAINQITAITTKVDVLINNAGIFIPGTIQTETEDDFETQMILNVSAPYYFTKGILPLMVPNKEGHIFNICSTASIMGYKNGGSYCISKHALLGFNRTLRQELMEHNIAVTAVLPGATYTQSWDGTNLPLERFMQPTELANLIYSCILNNIVVEELLARPMLGDI